MTWWAENPRQFLTVLLFALPPLAFAGVFLHTHDELVHTRAEVAFWKENARQWRQIAEVERAVGESGRRDLESDLEETRRHFTTCRDRFWENWNREYFERHPEDSPAAKR